MANLRDKIIQIGKDRIGELPVDVLDNIMRFLPIEEAARTAVLSRAWRDTWFSLTHLNFDDSFFDYMKKQYSYDWTCRGLHVIHKVLLQHKGSIRKFVFSFQSYPIFIRSRSFDFDQWFLRVTRKGVEEIRLSFTPAEYILPNYIFSCPTLKILYLDGVYFQPVSDPSILPNVTSLYFKQVNFKNIIARIANVPMLENLSFTQCKCIFDFKITSPKLGRLTTRHSSMMLPAATLDMMRSICTLDLDCLSLGNFYVEVICMDPEPQLNVEFLKLSNNENSSKEVFWDFIGLVGICPKLCRLDMSLQCVEAMPISYEDDEDFLTVARAHKMLHTLKFSSFTGSISEIFFIKGLIANFPTLEKVIISCHKNFSGIKEFDIYTMKKFLHSFRASEKTEIIYN